MEKVRIAVLMWYDDAIREYAEINEHINRLYCEKHGLDFYSCHERTYTDRHPKWERIPMMQRYLELYDYVIWVDADAYFYMDSPSIIATIRDYPNANFIFSQDLYNEGLNTGVIISKKNVQTLQLLSRWGFDDMISESDQISLMKLFDANVLDIQTHSVVVEYGVLQHFHGDELLVLSRKPLIHHLAGQPANRRVAVSTRYYHFVSGFSEKDENNNDQGHGTLPSLPEGKLVISWFSHVPNLNTGYGTQTNQVVSRLKKEGHDVRVNPTFGGGKNITDFVTAYGDRIPIYPMGNLLMSNDLGPLNYKHQKQEYHDPDSPSLLLGLLDVDYIQGDAWNDIPMFLWVPIATTPLPRRILDRLQQPNAVAIAMCEFGADVMREAGIRVFGYVPHAFEEHIFVPRDTIQGIPAREFLNVDENCFLVGMIVANFGSTSIHRKAFAECVMAFRDFAKGKKNVRLYMHTDMVGISGGKDLVKMCKRFGVDEDLIAFPDPAFFNYESDREVIAGICSACDVGLVASYGEGFGLATIEFQAVGTPVIATDFAASPELLGPDSKLVPGQLLYDYVQETFYKIPHIPSIVEALHHFYVAERKRIWPETMRFAHENYGANVVFERHWKPVLDRIYANHILSKKKSKTRETWYQECRQRLVKRPS